MIITKSEPFTKAEILQLRAEFDVYIKTVIDIEKNMTEKKLLIGSLSNDLLRVANLMQRGSTQAAERFFLEAKKWAAELHKHTVKKYILNIIEDVQSETDLSLEKAEKFLMYSVLLQNYSLRLR